MQKQMAIVGVGYSGFSSISPGLSYKELMYEAAVRAYQDAGIDPRQDADGFVTVAEDFHEGTSIFDEYVPDQLGAVMRPVHTVTGDGIHGLIAGALKILSGAMNIVVVEGHSKASNILTLSQVTAYALDPIYNRPLGLNPYSIAGLEMQRFLHQTKNTVEQCARVVVKNRRNALNHPSAGHGSDISLEDVLASERVASPLRKLDIAPHSDGCVVFVLASADAARDLTPQPIWIRGMGWSNGSYSLEQRNWAHADYARQAAQMAYHQAGVEKPHDEIDFAEIDDTFSYKELQHMEALELCGEGEAGRMIDEGATQPGGSLPINVSGGSLGVGNLLEASGLQRVLEVVLQLRGQASARQLKNVETGLAFAWRGLPTASGAALVLSR
ncbi:MAG: acetyl-CoA acetyltransferase [Chloroflexi bacterium]|nr:acetyl-CoA acetyltransferase [Chloroflexota bacterium]